MKVETISHKYSAATFNIHWVAVPGRRGAGASSVGTYSEHREERSRQVLPTRVPDLPA